MNEATSSIKEVVVSPRQQYEYCTTPLVTGVTMEKLREFLNEKGALGWELCATDYGHFIFKRLKR